MTAGYHYYICDVFTNTRFGGNQLAVVPEAAGLSNRQMQQIAREFNFFTPTTEVPFAGHPNIGTAFVLATTGASARSH